MTVPIPYVALRAGEEPTLESNLVVLPGGRGLGYRHERDSDRDRRGILLARCSGPLKAGQATGTPRYDRMHPRRQRRAMTQLLCQVCAERADRSPLGVLFLAMPPKPGVSSPGWPEGMLTHQPPVCLSDAVLSRRYCRPMVAHGSVAVRVKDPVPYGVIGSLYREGLTGPEPMPVEEPLKYVPLPFTEKRLLPWFLASHLAVRLREVTVVDLDEELEAARQRQDDRVSSCPVSGASRPGVGS